jgi:hypothetical protein
MFNFRIFLEYLELPKNELQRLGKTRCRSRKLGVNSRKGGSFINPSVKLYKL